MKKIISYFLIYIIYLSFAGCANTIHYPDNVPKKELAFLDTMSTNDAYVTITNINGEYPGDAWNGSEGDHYVRYGKTHIRVTYYERHIPNYTAYLSLSFNTLPGHTYKISSTVDAEEDEVTIKVTDKGKIMTKKTATLTIPTVQPNNDVDISFIMQSVGVL